jgi:hypothetical protein
MEQHASRVDGRCAPSREGVVSGAAMMRRRNRAHAVTRPTNIGHDGHGVHYCDEHGTAMCGVRALRLVPDAAALVEPVCSCCWRMLMGTTLT